MEFAGFGVPAGQRGLADFLEHFEKESLLAAEVTVQDGLGHAGGAGDLFRRRILVSQGHEQLLGLGQ